MVLVDENYRRGCRLTEIVERAMRRTALLAYTGTPALPVVAGTWVTPEGRRPGPYTPGLAA